jgi:hypothetical protein
VSASFPFGKIVSISQSSPGLATGCSEEVTAHETVATTGVDLTGTGISKPNNASTHLLVTSPYIPSSQFCNTQLSSV